MRILAALFSGWSQRSCAEFERLQAEIDRKSQMPGDHRYWEGRYRDEAARVDVLDKRLADRSNEILSLREQLAAANRRIAGNKEELAAEEARLREQLGFEPIMDRSGQLMAGNDAQAARAMSRQTKGNFQAYQAAVKAILDRLNDLCKSNVITKEDVRRLREMRKDLSNQIRREI